MGEARTTGCAGCRTRWLVSLCLAAGFLNGCSQGEADCLARIGRKGMARAGAVAEEANARVAAGWLAMAIRGEAPEVSLEDRVRRRLSWDKELDGAEISVQVIQAKVELRGKVRNAEQKQRARGLAQTTVGVEAVDDQLQDTSPPASK